MVLSLLWFVTLTAPLIALMLSAGCTTLPRAVSETGFVATTPSATPAVVPPDVAAQYWKRDQSREIKYGPAGIVSIINRDGPPDEELTRGRRVAITEFSVEFVDLQFQNLFGHPTTIKSSPAETPALTLPVQIGMELSGIGMTLTPISKADQIHTSQALRDVFERVLRASGLIIVPQQAVTASAGYARLKPRPSVSSSWAIFLNPVPTDTGIVLRTHTVAAPGLGVATCGAAAMASAEAEIKRETDADVVMAVKLRVGTYHKKAALEQNSVIRWTAANRSITLTAQKALVSDADVTDAPRFFPVAGRIEPVQQDQFVGQLEEMLPAFIGLAFPTLQARVGRDDPFARGNAAASR